MVLSKTHIGKLIRELRLKNNMSQEEIAKKIPVSNRTWSDWENGRVDFTIERLSELANVFDVSLNYFLDIEYEEMSLCEVKIKNSGYKNRLFGLFILMTVYILFFLTLVTPSNGLNMIILFMVFVLVCYGVIKLSTHYMKNNLTISYTKTNKLIYQSNYDEKALKNLNKEVAFLIVLSIGISLFSAISILGFYTTNTLNLFFDNTMVLLFLLTFIWGIILLFYMIVYKPVQKVLSYYHSHKYTTLTLMHVYIGLLSAIFMYGLLENSSTIASVPSWFVITIYLYLLIDILLLLITNYFFIKYYNQLDIYSVNTKTNNYNLLYSASIINPELPE